MTTPSVKESIAEKVATTKHGKPKAQRPDGSFYSDDPKVRVRELQEDGKIGAKGSDLAKEQGKLGGRPRKISAQQLVAEKAQEDAEEIYAALKAGMYSDSAKTQRESAQAILDVEEKVEKRKERAQARAEGLDKDTLIGMLVERLTGGGPAAKAIRERMEGRITDAVVVEERELPAGSAD